MKRAPVKIGVIIVPFDMGDDCRALKYLILHQNTIQQSLEFQILPVTDDDIIEKLSCGGPLERDKIEKAMPEYLIRYRESLVERSQGYDLQPEPDIPIVLLTTATFTDNYFLTGEHDWVIIALGNWQRSLAPPSIIEFYLSILVGSSIEFACDDNYPGSHISIKGCCFDFAAELEDARLSVLSGFICSDCLTAISKAHSKQLAMDAQTLLQKSWLGTVSDPSDVAVMAKKLGHDLFHTKGVSPTLWERTRATFEEEAVKTILKILALIIGAALLVSLGLKDAG